jgi:hypothetical protein
MQKNMRNAKKVVAKPEKTKYRTGRDLYPKSTLIFLMFDKQARFSQDQLWSNPSYLFVLLAICPRIKAFERLRDSKKLCFRFID